MKFFVRYIFIIFLLGTSPSNSNENIVFIDIDYVLNNSNVGKSIYSELEKLHSKNIKIIETKEKDLNEKKDAINKKKNILTKEQLKKEINSLNQEFEKYKIEKKKLVNNFKSQKKQKLDDFLIKINPIIEEYMNENSIDIILEKNQIFIGKTKKDITNEILKLANKEL